MLKRSYDNQADIPAGFESLYKEQDGKFVRDDSQIEAAPASSADITRLNAALKKERDEHKATKTQLTAKEAERAQAAEALETLQLSVDAGEKKVDDTKITELVTARVNAKVAPLNKTIDELKTQLAAKDQEIVAFQGERVRNNIVGVVTQAARAAKIVDEGLDEVTDLATRLMEIDDTGKPVVKANNPLGITAGLDAGGLLGELKAKRPYLWPASVGGGAKGSNGGGAQGDWAKMNLTERGQFIKTHGMDKANQMAKAAGFENAAALKPTPKN